MNKGKEVMTNAAREWIAQNGIVNIVDESLIKELHDYALKSPFQHLYNKIQMRIEYLIEKNRIKIIEGRVNLLDRKAAKARRAGKGKLKRVQIPIRIKMIKDQHHYWYAKNNFLLYRDCIQKTNSTDEPLIS